MVRQRLKLPVPLRYPLWSRGLLSQAGEQNTALCNAGSRGRGRTGQCTRKGSVKACHTLSAGRIPCSCDVSVGCFFPSLCFEILSCWTHTWAVFQPWLWRQQAERRPLIFLPKEFLPLSADVSLAEAQVSSHSEQYSSNEINGMLWLEHWKTHTHAPL